MSGALTGWTLSSTNPVDKDASGGKLGGVILGERGWIDFKPLDLGESGESNNFSIAKASLALLAKAKACLPSVAATLAAIKRRYDLRMELSRLATCFWDWGIAMIGLGIAA